MRIGHPERKCHLPTIFVTCLLGCSPFPVRQMKVSFGIPEPKNVIILFVTITYYYWEGGQPKVTLPCYQAHWFFLTWTMLKLRNNSAEDMMCFWWLTSPRQENLHFLKDLPLPFSRVVHGGPEDDKSTSQGRAHCATKVLCAQRCYLPNR